jgi:peptide subunit release factor RF-3
VRENAGKPIALLHNILARHKREKINLQLTTEIIFILHLEPANLTGASGMVWMFTGLLDLSQKRLQKI